MPGLDPAPQAVRFKHPRPCISLLSFETSNSIDVCLQGQTLASVWKIPWVRRQRARLRRPLQILVSPVLSNYIKLVIKTSKIIAHPPDYQGAS